MPVKLSIEQLEDGNIKFEAEGSDIDFVNLISSAMVNGGVCMYDYCVAAMFVAKESGHTFESYDEVAQTAYDAFTKND